MTESPELAAESPVPAAFLPHNATVDYTTELGAVLPDPLDLFVEDFLLTLGGAPAGSKGVIQVIPESGNFLGKA